MSRDSICSVELWFIAFFKLVEFVGLLRKTRITCVPTPTAIKNFALTFYWRAWPWRQLWQTPSSCTGAQVEAAVSCDQRKQKRLFLCQLFRSWLIMRLFYTDFPTQTQKQLTRSDQGRSWAQKSLQFGLGRSRGHEIHDHFIIAFQLFFVTSLFYIFNFFSTLREERIRQSWGGKKDRLVKRVAQLQQLMLLNRFHTS